MKHLFLLVGLVISLNNFCQELKWQSGVLITKEREVVVGSMVYYPAHDAILFKHSNGQVDLFPSQKISSFRYYDSKSDINRQFISLRKQSPLAINCLMEIVLYGSVKIVRELKFKGTELNYADDADGFYYFVLMGEELIPLQKFRSKVLPFLMKKFPDEIAKLIAEKKKEKHEETVAIQIVKEYNRLAAEPNLIALAN